MRHFFLSTTILLLFLTISCEDNSTINFNEEKEFFRESGNFLYYKGNPFSGIIESYYDNGQLFKKLTYKEGYVDRKGIYEEYYKNGKLVELDENGNPIINYEMESNNLQIINGKIYRNKRLFTGILNSSFKKDDRIFEYNVSMDGGDPIGSLSDWIGVRISYSDRKNPQFVFDNSKNDSVFLGEKWVKKDENFNNYLGLIKQKIGSEEKTILLREFFQDLDEVNKRKIGELKFNPKKNEVILLTLMDNKPFSGKVLKNKIVCHFSEYIDSSNKIRYDLDRFLMFRDDGKKLIEGEFKKGLKNGNWFDYNSGGWVEFKTVYTNGLIDEKVKFFKNGVVSSKSTFENGKLLKKINYNIYGQEIVTHKCESSVTFHIENLNKIVQYIDYNGRFYYGEFFDPQYGKNFFFKIYVDDDCKVISVEI